MVNLYIKYFIPVDKVPNFLKYGRFVKKKNPIVFSGFMIFFLILFLHVNNLHAFVSTSHSVLLATLIKITESFYNSFMKTHEVTTVILFSIAYVAQMNYNYFDNKFTGRQGLT